MGDGLWWFNGESGTKHAKTAPNVIVYVARKVLLEVLEFSKSNGFLTVFLAAILVNIFCFQVERI